MDLLQFVTWPNWWLWQLSSGYALFWLANTMTQGIPMQDWSDWVLGRQISCCLSCVFAWWPELRSQNPCTVVGYGGACFYSQHWWDRDRIIRSSNFQSSERPCHNKRKNQVYGPWAKSEADLWTLHRRMRICKYIGLRTTDLLRRYRLHSADSSFPNNAVVFIFERDILPLLIVVIISSTKWVVSNF